MAYIKHPRPSNTAPYWVFTFAVFFLGVTYGWFGVQDYLFSYKARYTTVYAGVRGFMFCFDDRGEHGKVIPLTYRMDELNPRLRKILARKANCAFIPLEQVME